MDHNHVNLGVHIKTKIAKFSALSKATDNPYIYDTCLVLSTAV